MKFKKFVGGVCLLKTMNTSVEIKFFRNIEKKKKTFYTSIHKINKKK